MIQVVKYTPASVLAGFLAASPCVRRGQSVVPGVTDRVPVPAPGGDAARGARTRAVDGPVPGGAGHRQGLWALCLGVVAEEVASAVGPYS